MNPWVRGPPARKGGRKEEGLCTRGARVTGPQRGAERGRPLHPGCAGHRPAERGGKRKASVPPGCAGHRPAERGGKRKASVPPGYAGHRPARGWWERGRF